MIPETQPAAAELPRDNPFPGLRSFEPWEDHLFFGRETQVDQLLTRLRRSRFLAVVGASGSGKSSLVRCGLIQSLHSGFMVQAGSAWRVALFRPGDDPIGNLAAALAGPEALGGDPEWGSMYRSMIETTLRRSDLGLVNSVQEARLDPGENLLVVVDQFEELFRYKHSRVEDAVDQAALLVKLLLQAAGQSAVPVYVVLTMRSDFIGNCTELAGLAEAVNDGQFLVPRMNREERRSAIEGPVAVAGGEISQRLVQRLLNDVGDDPDQLPILQHALMRTWDYWQEHAEPGEPLDLPHYEAVGTLKRALSQHAEEAFRELTDDRERRIAEVTFKALTDKGQDSRGVRRPCRLAEVAAIAEVGEAEVAAVAERFRRAGRSFLMPPAGTELTGETILDISHESLMRVWERLARWVDQEAGSARLYLRLAGAAERYQAGQAGLWRDPEIQMALNWRQEAAPTAAWARRYDPAFERAMLFLDHSRDERDRFLERREQERRRQLRRARLVAVVLGLGIALTLGFGILAFQARTEALADEREALSQKQEAEKQRGLALEQKEEAEAQRRSAEAAREEAQRQQAAAEAARLAAETQERLAIAQEREAEAQRRSAVAAQRQSEESRAEALDAARAADSARQDAEQARVEAETAAREARRLAMLRLAHALAAEAASLRQAEERQTAALLALTSYRLHQRYGESGVDPAVYDALLASRDRLLPDRLAASVYHGHGDAVRSVAPAPDGSTVATGSDDGWIRFFAAGAPGRSARTLEHGAGVRALAWSRDGSLLASGGADGRVKLWRQDGGSEPVHVLERHEGMVYGLAFTPDGRLLSAGQDGRVAVWDPAAGELLGEPLAGHPHRVHAVAVSDDGAWAAAASGGGGVLLWPAAELEARPRVLVPGEDVRAVSFDGRVLVAGTGRGSLVRFRLDPAGAATPLEPLADHESAVTSLAAAGGTVVSGSLDGTVHVSKADMVAPLVLRGHGAWVWSTALSPDGSSAWSGGADHVLRSWPTDAESLADELCAALPPGSVEETARRHLPADLPAMPLCDSGGGP